MASQPKRSRYDLLAAATAQFYNSTGTVPTSLQLATDISYLVTNQPSCTIVVADLPSGCSEHDLIALFSRYGQTKNAKMVCSGRAALVEFTEISSPTRLVHMAKINPFCVGPNRVRLEFSSETIAPSTAKKTVSNVQQSGPSDSNTPTKILHLDIANAEYPITVDVIKAICSPYGKILRIFIGKKNVDQSLEALVEFETVEEAKAAKKPLDCADIYAGCCSLSVGYSRLQRIHVTKNDTESWDFTGPNSNLEGPLNSNTGQRTLLGPAATGNAQTVSPAQMATMPPTAPTPAILPHPNASVTSMYPVQYSQSLQYGYYGASTYCPPMYPVSDTSYAAAYQSCWPTPIPTAQSSQFTAYNNPYGVQQIVILPTPQVKHHVSANGVGIGHSTSNMSLLAPRENDLTTFQVVEGVVLMVSSLSSRINCDNLFNMFCVYGNIAKIKFTNSRPGCALVQTGSVESANLIEHYYNDITIFGQTMVIGKTKHTELTEGEMYGNLPDGSPVMKNYIGDTNNRFRNAMVASKSRILDPSRTLHFFNAPLNISPDDVCKIFGDGGVNRPPRVVIFTPKPDQKTSLGLVEWDTVSEALEALVLMNHYPIHLSGFAHPFHLKLAYSPKPISNERAGVSMIRYPAPPITKTSKPVIYSKPELFIDSNNSTTVNGSVESVIAENQNNDVAPVSNEVPESTTEVNGNNDDNESEKDQTVDGESVP